jgi:hypothetical protein
VEESAQCVLLTNGPSVVSPVRTATSNALNAPYLRPDAHRVLLGTGTVRILAQDAMFRASGAPQGPTSATIAQMGISMRATARGLAVWSARTAISMETGTMPLARPALASALLVPWAMPLGFCCAPAVPSTRGSSTTSTTGLA